MPFYEYACDDCLIFYKTRHGIDAAGPDKCNKCSGALRKVLSAPYLNTKNHSSPTEAKYANLSVKRRDREREGDAEGLPDHLGSARGEAQSLG